MSSKKLEDTGAKVPTIELLLPITLYWEVEGLIKRIDYMTSASEDPVLIAEVYQKVLRKIVRHAVVEKDRIMLLEKINGAG